MTAIHDVNEVTVGSQVEDKRGQGASSSNSDLILCEMRDVSAPASAGGSQVSKGGKQSGSNPGDLIAGQVRDDTAAGSAFVSQVQGHSPCSSDQIFPRVNTNSKNGYSANEIIENSVDESTMSVMVYATTSL